MCFTYLHKNFFSFTKKKRNQYFKGGKHVSSAGLSCHVFQCYFIRTLSQSHTHARAHISRAGLL